MQGVEAPMYLGNRLNRRGSIKEEITYQMQQVTITWKRLQTYWKATQASKKWQLLVYDAIIKSKLLYGLETAQLGKAELKRIDAFQIRGIRQILGKNTRIGTGQPPTHIYLIWQVEYSVRVRPTKHHYRGEPKQKDQGGNNNERVTYAQKKTREWMRTNGSTRRRMQI